ncbi:hypothetical protein TcasGA2_TC033557 [Tribolium castaneum]|uniref:Uncharacterized protein n=1 Tax=Tribolium castaneum TaxID=7070 RepID=A0A139WGB2_TRICA|nr:hypothetical protein TcasGA2_TC033557 [Tribolium castaneum]
MSKRSSFRLNETDTVTASTASTEKVAILDDTLTNMETSIRRVHDSVNGLESRLTENLRMMIREEIREGLKNLKIVYDQN